MKNINYKKIIISSLAMLLLITPAFSFAASFNDDSRDYQTLRVGNITDNPNSDSSSWGITTNADAGERINFSIYYHNTSNETARNVRIRLSPQTTGVGISQVFTAYVWADNTNQVSSSATVNLSSSQSISYADNVIWRPNQTTWGSQILPNGQNGSEIFNSNGLLIGDIEPGWSAQGNVMVAYLVGSTSPFGSVPSATTNSASNIGQNYATLNSSVNPNNSNTNIWFEYGTTQSLGNTIGNQSIGNGSSIIYPTAYLSGLTSNTTYYYRVVAQNSYGTSYGSILSFTTTQGFSGQVPTVSTNIANSVSYNFATLNGSVNPNNSITAAWFEYGTTQSLGSSVGSQSVGSGNNTINYSTSLNYLNPNTTYYYRAVAQNSYGISYGLTVNFNTSDQSYNAAPSATTNSASNIGQNYATLNSSVNPNNSNTNIWFEYGTTQSLGNTIGNQSIGNGSSIIYPTAYLSGLTSNTTYYYRVVAQNSYGTSYGSILSFTGGLSISGTGNYPNVTVSPATYIATNSAFINGFVNPNNSLTTTWFEWGIDLNLSNKTQIQSAGAGAISVPMAYILSNLYPSTTYYFKLVGQNQYGTSYSDILKFTTKFQITDVVDTKEVIKYITVKEKVEVAKGDTLLIPSINKDKISLGEEIEFTLIYKNENEKDIDNAIIRIILPMEVEYQNSNPQPNSQISNNFIYNIGEVKSGTIGTIVVKAKIKDIAISNNYQLVFNAIMDYIDSNDKSQSISAYLTAIIEGDKMFFASMIDVVKLILGDWTGLLVLFLVVVAYFAHRKYLKKKERQLSE